MNTIEMPLLNMREDGRLVEIPTTKILIDWAVTARTLPRNAYLQGVGL